MTFIWKMKNNVKQLVIFLISFWDYKVDLKQITKLIEYQIFNFLLHRFQWFNDCFGCKNIDIFWKPSRWRRSILAFICSVLCHWTVQCTDIDCTRVQHHCNVVVVVIHGVVFLLAELDLILVVCGVRETEPGQGHVPSLLHYAPVYLCQHKNKFILRPKQ